MPVCFVEREHLKVLARSQSLQEDWQTVMGWTVKLPRKQNEWKIKTYCVHDSPAVGPDFVHILIKSFKNKVSLRVTLSNINSIQVPAPINFSKIIKLWNIITRPFVIQYSDYPRKVCRRLRDVSLAGFQSLLFPNDTTIKLSKITRWSYQQIYRR